MAGTINKNFDYVSSWEKIIRIWTGKAVNQYGNYALFDRDYDDIYQELWVRVLEKSKEKEGTNNDLRDEKNQPIVTNICRNAIIDMKKYDQVRSRETTMNMSDTNSSDSFDKEDDSSTYNALTAMGYNVENPDYDVQANLQALYDRFPEGSKERIYLDFWGTESGANPTSKNLPPKSLKNDGFTRDALAKLLGYASSSSTGFNDFEDKMKALIVDYFKE